MGLAPINRLGHAIGQAVRSIYRITPVKRSIDSGLAFLQAHGHGDTNDTANQELLQEADIDDIQHFGFESFPTQDGETEYIVVDADGGIAAIASRRALPSALAALAAKEARIYGEDGQSVLMKAGGDIEGEPKAGKHFKIGATATQFAAMANLVKADLEQMKTDFDAHVHLAGTIIDSFGGACTLSSAAPTVPMTAPAAVECTKLKIE